MNLISRQNGIRVLLLAVVLVLLGHGLMAQSGGLVIEGGTLIDGTGAPPLQNAVIVIQGNKIIAVGKKGTVSSPQGAQVIQAAGKFILPGLIDAHVHFQPWTAELYLGHGVTSVVDLGSTELTLGARDLIASGQMRGPRIFPTVRAHNGRTNWMSDPDSWGGIASPEEARQHLRELAGPGKPKYYLTKVYTETPPDVLRAVTEESHEASRNVTGHLGLLDARQAVEAGLDGVAHFTGIALATMSDPAKAEEFRYFMRMGIAVDYPLYLAYHAFMDPVKVDQLIPFLVQKNVRVQPEFVNIGRWALPHMRELYRGEDRRLL